jgi:NitT/TauT family transport system substrate-binding protein/putative hydroxymethylpyrimidine transport system substrate-binding protein
MSKVAALLAAALLAVLAPLMGCGGEDGGAEPGASKDATLILDFQPNAVHAGIYSALKRGFYSDEGIRLKVRRPSESTDAPKLLRAGRAQFAILDIHDLGIAVEKGFGIVGLMPVVQRPLAAVIARDRAAVRTPRDLEGKRVGVTGLPSDDAVLDSVLEAGGADPAKVGRVTIGFNAVADLRAGKVDAATAFWNAEGVLLRRAGVPTREFRVDGYGAPRYPELVLATTAKRLDEDRELIDDVVKATTRGYRFTLAEPERSLGDLASEVPGIDRAAERASLRALVPAMTPAGSFDGAALEAWSRWDADHGILRRPVDVSQAFRAAG